jgi:hypothetical protein
MARDGAVRDPEIASSNLVPATKHLRYKPKIQHSFEYVNQAVTANVTAFSKLKCSLYGVFSFLAKKCQKYAQ